MPTIIDTISNEQIAALRDSHSASMRLVASCNLALSGIGNRHNRGAREYLARHYICRACGKLSRIVQGQQLIVGALACSCGGEPVTPTEQAGAL